MADGVKSLTTLGLAEYSASTESGSRLLAQFTDREVVVYQAYKPELGNWALEHGYFGGGFSFARTSWIKPNFTWMMHRCGWGSKQNQEVILALFLRRDYWDDVLSQAVMSSYNCHLSTQREEEKDSLTAPSGRAQSRWKASLRASNVVMQWDPDHAPFTGNKTSYRVIQLGLRRDALAAFRGPAFGGGGIQDVTAFAKATKAMHDDHPHDDDAPGGTSRQGGALLLPAEEPYPVSNPQVARRLGIS